MIQAKGLNRAAAAPTPAHWVWEMWEALEVRVAHRHSPVPPAARFRPLGSGTRSGCRVSSASFQAGFLPARMAAAIWASTTGSSATLRTT